MGAQHSDLPPAPHRVLHDLRDLLRAVRTRVDVVDANYDVVDVD